MTPTEATAQDALIERTREKLKDVLSPERLWRQPMVPPPTPQELAAFSDRDLARYIDHTILLPEATRARMERHCAEARRLKVAAVSVHQDRLQLCLELLAGSGVKAGAVLGFPYGASPAGMKAYEAATLVAMGAQELDMVLNIGRLKDGEYAAVRKDIELVAQAAGNVPVKVILETCLLTEEEKIAACLIARAAGAAFVKTSTGFAGGGATVEDVALMRRIVGTAMGVKAAGGIRSAQTARAMLRAGANRMGTSTLLTIVGEQTPNAIDERSRQDE